MTQDKAKIIHGLIIAGVVISSVLALGFLGFVLEQAYGGGSSRTVNVGSKTGAPASSQQLNAGYAKESVASDARPSPTPTPIPEEGALPNIPGFNPDMKLERISIWWDGKMNEGKASTDAYLRYTYAKMCTLLEEIEDYTPTGSQLKFTNTFGGGREQEFTVFESDIAEFKGYEGRYFRIPPISVLADALLPIQDGTLASSIQARMEDSGMLGYYGEEQSCVFLNKEISKEVTTAFLGLERHETEKPPDLPKRTTALVFYYYAAKYYIDVYETGLIRFNTKNRDEWFTAPLDQLENFEKLVINYAGTN